MKNLRILKICDLEWENFEQTFESKLPKDSKVNYSGSLNFLSVLYWHGCPFKFLPSNFYPENIVSIDLSYSRIKNFWTTPKCYRRLKVMKLSHCRNLTTTPDFTEITNLEELVLEGCVNLVTLHPSIRILSRLLVLNIRNCARLRRFPWKVKMDSLKVLIVSGCLKVEKQLEVFGTISTLVELHVDQRAITEFPYLFYTLTNLQVLSVSRQKGDMSRRRSSIFRPSYLKTELQQPKSLVLSHLTTLKFLKRLNVSDCDISEVSPDIGDLACLEALKLSRNKFACLPASLSQLSRLQHLILDECKKLEELPELPQSIISFHASYCTSLRKLSNLLIKHNSFRQRMFLMGWPKLVKILESLASTPSPQGLNYLSQKLDVLFYECRIPQWFTKRRVGDRIKVELPQGWCYNKFIGYETFVVFMAKDTHGSKGNYGQLGYSVSNYDKALLNDVIVRPIHVTSNIMSMNIGTYVTWLHYSSSNPSWIEAKNFVTFSFRGLTNIEMKECGVRVICQDDIKEENSEDMMQGLLSPTQDGDIFHLDQEWSSATIGDELSRCTRHIVWSSN